jgi:hypothetical protein
MSSASPVIPLRLELAYRFAPAGLDSQDCAEWRHLDSGNAPAVQNHEPVTMSGAKHARVFRKRCDDSLDDLVLVDRVVLLILDVYVVPAHESNP